MKTPKVKSWTLRRNGSAHGARALAIVRQMHAEVQAVGHDSEYRPDDVEHPHSVFYCPIWAGFRSGPWTASSGVRHLPWAATFERDVRRLQTSRALTASPRPGQVPQAMNARGGSDGTV